MHSLKIKFGVWFHLENHLAWFQELLTTMHGISRSGDPDHHTMAVNRTE